MLNPEAFFDKIIYFVWFWLAKTAVYVVSLEIDNDRWKVKVEGILKILAGPLVTSFWHTNILFWSMPTIAHLYDIGIGSINKTNY